MFNNETFISVLNLFTLVNKIALFAILFFQKGPTRFYKYLAFIVIAQVPIILTNYLSWINYDTLGVLIFLNYLFSISLYIASFGLIHFLLNINLNLNKWIKTSFLVLYGPYLVLSLYFLFFLNENQQSILFNSNFSKGQNWIYDIANSYMLIISMVLPIIMLSLIKKVQKISSNSLRELGLRLKFSKHIPIALLLSSFGVIIPFILIEDSQITDLIILPIVSNSLVFYLLYLAIDFNSKDQRIKFSFAYKGFFQNINLITDSNLNQETAKILRHLEEQKPFLDESYSIIKLSNELNIPSHKLSIIINNDLNKTFPDLIREYRLKEFKKRIVNEQYSHLSLEGIAKMCGYKSRSVMYKHFKEDTGITPLEYINSRKAS